MSAGIATTVTQDANNSFAVAMRGLGDMLKKASDDMVPDLARQSAYHQNQIYQAEGFNKITVRVS